MQVLPIALHPQMPTTHMPAACRDHLMPKKIEALDGKRITMMGGGWRHAVAADDQGRMYAWGWNKVSAASQAAEISRAVVPHDVTPDLSGPRARSDLGLGGLADMLQLLMITDACLLRTGCCAKAAASMPVPEAKTVLPGLPLSP